jgi:hypothetical protein
MLFGAPQAGVDVSENCPVHERRRKLVGVVPDLAHEAVELALLATQQEELHLARRHCVPRQNTFAGRRRSLDQLRGLGEPAL